MNCGSVAPSGRDTPSEYCVNERRSSGSHGGITYSYRARASPGWVKIKLLVVEGRASPLDYQQFNFYPSAFIFTREVYNSGRDHRIFSVFYIIVSSVDSTT